MPDILSMRAADNYRFAASRNLVELADGTYALINIPKFAFVKEVWLYISTPYSGGGADGTATIGFKGNGESADPDGFMDATAAAATTAGYKRASSDAQPASQGKWFNAASGQITITLAHNTSTVYLKGIVFVEYTVIH